MNEELEARLYHFLTLAEETLIRTLPLLPPVVAWEEGKAYLWQKVGNAGYFMPVTHVDDIGLDDLVGIEQQKSTLYTNTLQFVQGLPANHALLWGAHGTGKSSLVKALLNTFYSEGLRLVEVARDDLADLPWIATALSKHPQKFIVFCDDLSFTENESGYRALKVALDGSIAARENNVLVYATSNRRHLLPESSKDREDIFQKDAFEEKIALADRFGLWLAFYGFEIEAYEKAVLHWLDHFGVPQPYWEQAKEEALAWSRQRGLSGRAALQFARDFAGRMAIRATL
jgi:predicted AAA+ superfamily ATPase